MKKESKPIIYRKIETGKKLSPKEKAIVLMVISDTVLDEVK